VARLFSHPKTAQFNPSKAGLKIGFDILTHELALEKLSYSLLCLGDDRTLWNKAHRGHSIKAAQ
jgi:hypothetical protein